MSQRQSPGKYFTAIAPSKNLVYVGFVIGLVVSTCLVTNLVPSGGSTDVFLFRDAGCNLSLGLGFTSISLPGYGALERAVFASYTPGLPLLFGVVASIFGCSAETNAWFNWFQAALASSLVVCVFPNLRIGAALRLTGGFGFGLLGPTGLLLPNTDRPELLAFSLFCLTCIVCAGVTRYRPFWGGGLAALTALVHPLAGILTALLAILSCQAQAMPLGANLRWFWSLGSVRISVQFGIALISPLVFTWLVYSLLDPSAPGRFVAHAFGPSAGLGRQMMGFADNLKHAFFSSGVTSKFYVLANLVSFCSAAALMFLWRQQLGNLQGLLLLATLLSVGLIPIALFPAQNNYMLLSSLMLPIILVMSAKLFHLGAVTPSGAATLGCLILFYAFAGSILSIAHRFTPMDDYRRELIALSQLSSEQSLDRSKVVVLANPNLYFLYKARFPRLADYNFIGEQALHSEDIGGFVACLRGLRPETPLPTPAPFARRYELIKAPGPPSFSKAFGIQLMKSDMSWSCAVYRVWPAPGLPAGHRAD